jgi:glutathione S-transferase
MSRVPIGERSREALQLLPQLGGLWRAHRAGAQGPESCDYISVHLIKGERYKPEYAAINPQNPVPVLQDDAGQYMYQSLAIMQYLEEA